MREVRVAVAATLIASAAAGTGRAATPAPQTLPPCPSAAAVIDAPIDSGTANVGDVFEFTTVAPADPSPGAIPGGLRGFGVVSYAKHASRARGGALALEARYIVGKDGAKIPATIVASHGLARGSDRDLPFVFGLTALFHSAITSALSAAGAFYEVVHRGTEASLRAGSPLKLALGDGLTEGTCSAASLLEGPRNYVAPKYERRRRR